MLFVLVIDPEFPRETHISWLCGSTAASLHVGSDFEMSVITILGLEPHFQHHRYV